MKATSQVSIAATLVCSAGLCVAGEEMPVGHWSGDQTLDIGLGFVAPFSG